MRDDSSSSRRSFLKLIGATATAVGLSSLIPQAKALKLTKDSVSQTNQVKTQEIVSKVTNSSVYAGHPDFSTVQDAIDFAHNNNYGRVEVPPGDYGSINIPSGILVKGVSSFSNDTSKAPSFTVSSGSAITMSYHSKISQVHAETSDSSVYTIDTGTSNKVTVENVWIHNANGNMLRLNGHNCRVYGCELAGGTVLLDSSSANITVTGTGTNIGITDNGAGNTWSGIS